VEYTKDKKELLEHFLTDPVLFAYHIGDLDDFFFEHCRWSVLRGREDRIEEVILIYYGSELPTVIAFGSGDNFDRLLEQLIPELPDKFYCHHQERYSGILEDLFKRKPLGTHNKMKFSGGTFDIPNIDSEKICRLAPDKAKELRVFYDRAFPESYFNPRMLETGKYYGWFEDDKIISISGIHVYSKEYKTAVLGNIATAPEFRGRGIAAAVTGRLTRELVDEGLEISLNVRADNAPAVRCYTKIGYEIAFSFEESVFYRKTDS